MSSETPITFQLHDDALLGIVHEPEDAATTGVLVVVGGPQYRIGAHRQFVHLARSLADKGIAVMRFDYRGMGDSEGNFTGFENISEDIDAAIEAFHRTLPSLRSVVLWGLCDAASAIAMKAAHSDTVTGFVLLNPWVRTEEGEARAYLRHYYLKRLLSADFWKKVLGGKFKAGDSMKGLTRNVATSRQASDDPLPQRVTQGVSALNVPALLILSGNDLTAREFEDTAEGLLKSPPGHIRVARIPAADHTFSKSAWKDDVALLTADFIKGLQDRV
jgi:exosortase A-associated hydrolase 1